MAVPDVGRCSFNVTDFGCGGTMSVKNQVLFAHRSDFDESALKMKFTISCDNVYSSTATRFMVPQEPYGTY